MIIRSIRLKNIKSYGEGPDGHGVTVSFEQGINRIAGKNGHGKSTLIETLGFALFLTDPIYEEGFDVATYLLRTGKKAGEIDVVFSTEGHTYRIERGIGIQSKRVSKVVLVDDGSIEAEGDAMVSDYLCRMFGFSDKARFLELFAKLVGVKQGRLTWPFDSKPSEARKHFEPLLEVEIFRQCFERLKPVVDHFEALAHEREKQCAAVEERIKERADSPEKTKARQREVEVLGQKVDAAQREKQAADQLKSSHEKNAQAYREAKAALDAAGHQQKLAAQKRELDHLRMRESKDARTIVTATQIAHESFLKAERALRLLQEQQAERSRLQKQHAETTNAKTEWKGKSKGARQQAASYTEQLEGKGRSAEELRAQIAAVQKAQMDSKVEFDRRAELTASAIRTRDALDHWLNEVTCKVQENDQLLADILENWKVVSAWDKQALEHARSAEAQADELVKALSRKLAEAEKFKATLAAQVEQIADGVCPFLKERCHQFDPKKIGADILVQEKDIQQLTIEHTKAAERHCRAKAQVEKLAKEEARLTQVRHSIATTVNSFVAEHCQLLPSSVKRHLTTLQQYLPDLADKLRLEPAMSVVATELWIDSETSLNTDQLQELAKAENVFSRDAAGALASVADELQAEFKRFDDERTERMGLERDLKNKQEKLAELEREISGLSVRLEAQNKLASSADIEGANAAKRLAELDDQLRPYANLQSEVRARQILKDQNADGHTNYVMNRPLADKLEERGVALEKSIDVEKQANQQLCQKQESFTQTSKEFDAAALQSAEQRAAAASGQLAAEVARLETAVKECTRERLRVTEWEEARRKRVELLRHLERLHACMTLTQKARQVLQKAAPMVAQHVCQRIAGRAQQIFNQVNHDPVELDWNAERYSLRINPGERRFAMLSGGEQTKLSLAMVLAMIQEFSGLKVCIFDEPTYGVDADSRQKLADAILRLQDVGESKLDQLLLVSHDDAFEGKIEHVVFIRKTATEGSSPSNTN
jgi:exonuclease SbcC